jgi:YD repeat-containing protein
VNNPDALAAAAGDPLLAQLLASGDALVRRFDYDALYRLLAATGRECDVAPDGSPWPAVARCTDTTRARAYVERYTYDAVGNMLRLEHRNQFGGFLRDYMVEPATNRVRQMQNADSTYAYTFDATGNLQSETASRHFEWNHANQLKPSTPRSRAPSRRSTRTTSTTRRASA